MRGIGLSLIKLGGHLNKRKKFFPCFRAFKRSIFDLLNGEKHYYNVFVLSQSVKRIVDSIHSGRAHGVRWARRIGVFATHDLPWDGELPRWDITIDTVQAGAKREPLCTGKVAELLSEYSHLVTDVLRQDRRPQWQSLRHAILVLDRFVETVESEIEGQNYSFSKGCSDWAPNDLGIKRCYSETTPYLLRHGDVTGDVVDEIRKSLKYYSTVYSPSNPYDYDEDPYLEDMLDRFADY